MRAELKELTGLDREKTLFAHIGAVLGWDQETYMPEAAIDERSEQLASIEGLVHEKATSPRIGELLEALEGSDDLDEFGRAYLRLARRDYDKQTKLPLDFVKELARSTSLSQAAWANAKKNDDFPSFAPHLENMIELNRRMASYLDPEAKPYDTLLGLYEFGATETSVAAVFAQMKKDLLGILSKIRAAPQVDDSFLHLKVSAASQARLSELLMDAVGYDRSRGRLDTTAHPFTTTLGRKDIRITTRYIEEFFPSSAFSTIHESGHALYEMGIAPHPDYEGTLLADAASMAVHESQSRMWENMIGRSESFWKSRYATLQSLSEGALSGVSLGSFLKAVNKVEPSLIRTEADEVTYGLHVIARFQLESDLIGGKLAVKDLPAAWNATIESLLGVRVPNDTQGCLQDIHWSMGAFGYFPSYALGNLYAAQFWSSMEKAVPDVEERLSRGETGHVLEWLRANVHKPGAMYLPGELVEKVTGKPLDPEFFARYLERKYSRIYGF